MTSESPTQDPDGFKLQEYFLPGQGKRLRRLPALMRSAIAIVWRAAPRDLAICTALQLFTGAAFAVQLLLLRTLLGDLLAQRVPGFSALAFELVVLAVIAGLLAVAAVVVSVRQRILGQRVAMFATDGVIRTANAVDLITYDAPGFHDRLQRAQLSAAHRPAQMVNALIGLAGGSFVLAGIAAALLVIEPLFCLLVLVAYIPSWVATNATGRLVYRFTVDQTERERRRMYLFDLLTTKQAAQEIRAYGLGEFLASRQRRLYGGLIDDLESALRSQMTMVAAAQAFTALLAAGSLALLVYFVTSGRMSLSDAGTAAAAMILLTGRLRALASSAGGLYESSLYLEDYASFVAAAPRIEATRPTGSVDGGPAVVEAHAVGFTYPSRQAPSLQDVSLRLERGKVVALVGENGSGKTTFAKILAGLYEPEPGTVTWDGVDTASLDPASVREQVAVVFQDFARYELSAHDNIALGDHRRFDDTEAVERAARAASIHDTLATLPRGYEQLLGPSYYGGSNLSGGQWQRVGLARAFFRDSPIVILDEPTASLDPRAEAELYESMGALFAGRAVLLISHRFGSVRTADHIYVLKDGRVHESGTHAGLMARRGYYAELFELQAHLYVD